jgi:hypothetical protein
LRKFCCMLSASFLFLLAIHAQTQASAAVLQDRITQPIENANVMPVAGTVNPMARTEFDQGLIDNAKVLDGLRLTFKRSDAQEASLKALLLAQQDPASPSYHHWLTPTQFGQQFGMTAADIAKASDWLQAQGFAVTWVSQSNNAIGFSGSVASVEKAFQTQIHNYRVNGETHFANATNISVPAALSGLVMGVRGLDDFRPKPKVRYAKSNALSAKPQFTSGVSGSHYLTPPDMATIYDIGPLYSAGVTGQGVTIAIMGQTDIVPADIADFRAAAGLPANPPTVVTAPGTTPLSATAGAASGDLSETDLDLEYSGGIATGASIVLVNSDNVFTSLQYAVQSTIGGIAIPIISLSYGACEPSFATSDLTQIEGFLSQANAQGQTVMLASGDSGAADCDDSSGSTPITSATNGLQIDYPGSSVYVTDVGGTEFMGDGTAVAPQTGAGTYWSANGTGGAANDLVASAKSYIPEMVWNDTTYSISQGFGFSGGGGGVSKLWKKPSWQTGVPNIPVDGFRDVPDISLPASPDHDGLLYCTQIQTVGSGSTYVSSCQATSFRISDPGQSDDQGLTAAGGTSFAAPSFAGLLAITEQKLGVGGAGGGLGNINPSLYTLASNATTYSSAFHDVTTGNNQVPCTAGTPDCATTGSNNVIGFSAGTGYDRATGLGSVDANNFVTAYSALVTLTGTKIAIVASPSTNLTTNQGVTFTATVTPNTLTTAPAGTVIFTLDGVAQTPVPLSTAAPYTAVYTLPNGLTTGTHSIAATFTSSDSTYTGSTSTTVTVDVSAAGTAPTTTTVTASPSTFALGGAVTLSATITATTAGTLTGPIIFSTGNLTIGTVNQVSIGPGNTATATLNVSAATASLGFSAGTDEIVATYRGDGFNAPSSGSTNVTVTNPGITLSATNITISSPSPGNTGTSTVTLTSTGSYAGTATVTASATSLNANYGFGSTGASSASVALSAGGTGSTTIVITTVAATGNLQKGPAGKYQRVAAAGGTALGCILLLLIPGIRRKRWPVALAMLVFLSVGAGLGCGGGTAGAAPKGTYTVTLTATDSSNPSITGSTNFTVTIN